MELVILCPLLTIKTFLFSEEVFPNILATVDERKCVVLHNLHSTLHRFSFFPSNLQVLTKFPSLITDCVLIKVRGVSVTPSASCPASTRPGWGVRGLEG